MTTRGTAHGKVILFGEHAVVYGVAALAVGIERGAWAEASPRRHEEDGAPGAARLGVSTLHVRGWDVWVNEDADDDAIPLARAFRDILAATRDAQRLADAVPVGAVAVEAAADLPPGGGLGCSAALGVAVARALDPSATSDTIASRVVAWERVFHGNPSGIDAAVAALGGCVLFQRAPEASVSSPRLGHCVSCASAVRSSAWPCPRSSSGSRPCSRSAPRRRSWAERRWLSRSS